MGIYERIGDNRKQIESAYDLAAICYDYLCAQVEHQAKFLAEYTEYSEDAEENNPNIPRLKQFSYEISRVLLQKDIIYSLEKLTEKILYETARVQQQLEPYGIETYNEATVAYYLLQAVDLYAESKPVNSLSAPLNEKYRKNSYIYRCGDASLITAAVDQLKFRDKIFTTEIRNNLRFLCILKKEELDAGMNPPKMVTMHIEELDQVRRAIIKSKKLKIAVIPFGKEKLITFKKIQGSSFRVKYSEENKDSTIKKALDMLKAAIEQKANIIIFPEYVCFPEMQDAIGAYLRETYYKASRKTESLFLVIAGSGWTDDDNNVSRIYSYSGKLLGEQYKYSPYDGLDGKQGRWIEGLRNPGKESVIVKIPGIGSIMTAICRDISNRDQTERIADVFKIDFLMVAAWSKSLHGGFDRQLAAVTETNMTTGSLVCNCCGAVADRESLERGIVVTPYKKGSVIEAKINVIKGKKENCEKCAGCIFCTTLSFETQDIEKGKIVKRIAQKGM